MSTLKRGLSRGLESLLSERAKHLAGQNLTTLKEGDLQQIPLEQLEKGAYQPRKRFSEQELQELSDSIREQGVLQPIIVRQIGNQKYEVIAGERRWRAAELAGLPSIPALIRQLDDKPALAIALIENIQREDLNVLEEASALQRLLEEFQLTQEEVGIAVGKSRTSVSNSLRLLKLNPDVKTLLQEGLLEMGHARALLALTGETQSQAATKTVEKKWSVREVEAYVKKCLTEEPQEAPQAKSLPTEFQAWEKLFAEKLQTKVSIRHQKNGQGKVEIYYDQPGTLQTLLSRLSP